MEYVNERHFRILFNSLSNFDLKLEVNEAIVT